VRDHDDRLSVGLGREAEQLEDVGAGFRVEVARRLIGEDDRGLRDERARDRDALLLAAGELGGPVLAATLDPGARQQLGEPLLLGPLAGDCEREEDVFACAEHGQEIEELKHEADVLAAQLREMRVVEARDVAPGNFHGAAGGLVEAGEDVHERRLARPGGPHDGDELALGDLQ